MPFETKNPIINAWKMFCVNVGDQLTSKGRKYFWHTPDDDPSVGAYFNWNKRIVKIWEGTDFPLRVEGTLRNLGLDWWQAALSFLPPDRITEIHPTEDYSIVTFQIRNPQELYALTIAVSNMPWPGNDPS